MWGSPTQLTETGNTSSILSLDNLKRFLSRNLSVYGRTFLADSLTTTCQVEYRVGESVPKVDSLSELCGFLKSQARKKRGKGLTIEFLGVTDNLSAWDD